MINHSLLAEDALKAATTLRSTDPGWALVPLYYSAMHLVHIKIDSDPTVGSHEHCPKNHGQTRQLTHRVCGPLIGTSLTQLFTASHVARYQSQADHYA